jgi:hypothetical protein
MKSSRTSLATARARRARARSSIASARSISISGEAVGDISFLCAYERRLSCFSNWPIEVKHFQAFLPMSLTGPRFSPGSAQRPSHDGIRRIRQNNLHGRPCRLI